jgi:hypothetical protein
MLVLLKSIPEILRDLWYRDTTESSIYINEVAVRIRAGILLLIPLYMGLSLYDVIYTSKWIVDGNTSVDTFETNWDEHIIYAVEATKRVYEYSLQTTILFYALFEMIAGMFVFTSRFSPIIYLSSFLARKTPPVWKPLVPKRFAWTIGASLISLCIVFFNPDTFAGWVNTLWGSELLTTTENFLPGWVATRLVWVCLIFMWLEAVLGLCVGCKVHSLLVLIGVLKEDCEACNNIDWDEIAKKNSSSR